jgi:hypothetical protein
VPPGLHALPEIDRQAALRVGGSVYFKIDGRPSTPVAPERNQIQMATQDPFAAAYAATKGDHTLVVAVLDCNSAHVKSMVAKFAPHLRPALAPNPSPQVISLQRDDLDDLFGDFGPIPVGPAISALEPHAWPLMLMVNDDGVGIHALRAGESPRLESPIMHLGWPARIVASPGRTSETSEANPAPPKESGSLGFGQSGVGRFGMGGTPSALAARAAGEGRWDPFVVQRDGRYACRICLAVLESEGPPTEDTLDLHRILHAGAGRWPGESYKSGRQA